VHNIRLTHVGLFNEGVKLRMFLQVILEHAISYFPVLIIFVASFLPVAVDNFSVLLPEGDDARRSIEREQLDIH